jgi:hypothetical protein
MDIEDNIEALEEIWRPVKDYEDGYEISNLGRIRSLKYNKIMKATPTKDGYLRVRVSKNGVYVSKMIHRMVAEAFIPLPDNENAYEVDHKDDDVSNNVVTNLQWLTHAENLEKSFQRGHQSKLKKPLAQFDLDWNFVAVYESKNDAFRKTGIRHAGECALGVKYHKTAGGYNWRYVEDLEGGLDAWV